MRNQEDRREAILVASVSLLQASGVQALNFESLAQETGMSRQLVRYYFETKDDLMLALCDHLVKVYREILLTRLADISDGERLDFFLDFYFGLLEDCPKPRDDKSYDALFAWAAGSEVIRENLASQYNLVGQVISHEIQIKNEHLTTADSLELSYLMVCLMYGHWKMVASLGYSDAHNHITRSAIDCLIRSYADGARSSSAKLKPWTRQE